MNLAKSTCRLLVLRIVAVGVAVLGSGHLPADPPPVESVDGATRAMWLIDGTVVDAASGDPIDSFTVTPGTMSTEANGRLVVRWRDNLKREMRHGVFRWPRTSGFSEMRFRVTATDYRPLVTHLMRRGGPHTRITVSLRK